MGVQGLPTKACEGSKPRLIVVQLVEDYVPYACGRHLISVAYMRVHKRKQHPTEILCKVVSWMELFCVDVEEFDTC